MKKGLKIFARLTGGFILLIFVLLLVIPTLFREKVREKVIELANENIRASFSFEGYNLSLIRHFPNLSFSLKGISIVGIDKFEGDTLAGLKSFSLVFNLGSLLGKSGYEVRSVIIDRPVANAIVLEGGEANWDIMIGSPLDESGTEEEGISESKDAGGKALKLNLRKFEIRNGIVDYTDHQAGLKAGFNDMDIVLSGKMEGNSSQLTLSASILGLDLSMDGIKYLNNATARGNFDIEANVDDMEFAFGENSLMINDIGVNFTGTASMPGDDILTDISFSTGETGFKPLLSLVPAFYMKDFAGLKAEGTFSMNGKIKGRYNAADSVTPGADIMFYVKDGEIIYPGLPEKISDIRINMEASYDGAEIDNSYLNLNDFHFILAGNPFDMSLAVRTPVSDPEISGRLNGKIDLASLAKAVPVELETLEGLIDAGMAWSGRLSMINEGRYDQFTANGKLSVLDLKISMEGIPPVEVSSMLFSFSPSAAALEKLEAAVAGSDFSLSGNLSNYIPYIFSDATIKGELTLNSRLTDLDEIMSFLPYDSTSVDQDDTLSLALIEVPENIDFQFNSAIRKLLFKPLDADNVRGKLIIRDGVIRIEDTGLETMGGSIDFSATYDTRDIMDPTLVASASADGLEIMAAFESFNTIRQLAPVAEGMAGNVSVWFDFSSSLGMDMMPLVNTISGKGRLKSSEIQLVSSPVYEKFGEVLNLGDSFSNTFRNLDVQFSIKDGRVTIDPFDARLGAMKVNIGGDHGIDQTINYVVKSEIASADLPAPMKSMLTGLIARAALMGIPYTQPEIIKLNIGVTGTVKDPKIAPSLAGTDLTGGVKEAAVETAKQAVESIVEEAKDKVSDEARLQADKLIREAEEKAQLLKDEAARAAETIRSEAEANALKLIKEAESKGALAKAAASRAADALRNEAEKRATQVEEEAAKEADKVVTEARKKADELLGKTG